MRHLLCFTLAASLLGCGESHAVPGAIGAPCAGPDDCAEGLSCVIDARFSGGYCTRTCEDGSCPSMAACDATSAPPLCLASCTARSECREGYQCWRGGCAPACASDGDCGVAGATCGADGQCVGPECTSDDECGASERCAGGSCVPIPPDGGMLVPLGEPCASDAACESGICLPSTFGGVCTVECTEARDCIEAIGDAGCGAIGVDSNGDGAPDSVRALCVPVPPGARTIGRACARDDECEARICQEGQCTEVCNGDDDCLTGQVCASLTRAGVPGGTFTACGYGPRTSAVQVDAFDLGEQDLEAGRVASFELAAPPDAVSITLQARRLGGDPLEITFFTVDDPTDRRIFDVEPILSLEDQPERWLPFDTGESITMLVPNTSTDRLAFVPGLHRFAVATVPRSMGDTGSARVRVSALVKRASPRPVTSGALDLNVFLVGVGITAATAPTSTRVTGALSRLDAILGGEAAITVGDVDYYDITGADATQYQVVDTTDGEDSELARLFRLSAPRSGRRLNIFLVRSIEGGSGGFHALGIAGGIPGPVGIHGTQHSGVVVAFDPSVVGSGSSGANVVGHVLAHEISHYLGLFHSTEQSPPCAAGELPPGCSPFGAGDTLADTTRGDMTNLMYWSIVGSGTNDELSLGQAFVLRLSAQAVP